jgi:GGDEF domain-containing protein
VLLPSLNRSLDQPDIPQTLSRPLFEYSAEILFRALPTLYATLNKVLQNQGILITLEQDQATYGALLPRLHQQASEPRRPRHRPTRDTKVAPDINPALHTDTTHDWVSLKVPPTQVNLLRQLMQSMSAATNFATFADVFVSGLFARTNKLAGPDHPLRPAMLGLEQTFKAFARSDPSFITDTEHPARRGLDTLFHLSTRAHLAGPTSDTETRAVLAQLQQLTSIDDFVSSDMQDQLSTLLVKAQSRFERNIQRVREMELGRTRYLDAKLAAYQQLAALLGSNTVSASLMALIESALVELFTLNILQPDGSDEFANIESALRCLAETLNTLIAGNSLSENELETANQQLALLEQHLDKAFPTRVQLQNLLHSLRREIETQAAEPASAEQSQAFDIDGIQLSLEERLEFLPRLKRGVSHALRLSDGLWFNWRSAQSNSEKRFLAWIDPGKQRFVFTDHRGYHAETIGLVGLARRIGRTLTAENPIDTLPASNQYLLSQLTEFTPILDSHIERDDQTGLLARDSFHRQIELSMKQSYNQGRCLHLVAVRLNNSLGITQVFDSVVADTLDQHLGRQLAHLPSNLFIGGRLNDRDWGIICFEGSAARLRQRLTHLVRAQHSTGIELNHELIEAEVSCIVITMDIEASEQTSITPIFEFLDQTTASSGVQTVRFSKLAQQQDAAQPEPGIPFQPSNFDLWSQQVTCHNRASNEKDVRLIFSVRPIRSSHALDCTELPKGIEQQRALDLWRLRAVLSWLKNLADQSIECPHCIIDVSAASLLDSQFTDHVLNALSDYGVGTRRLWMRLDLSFSEADFRSVTEFAQTMNDIGCRIVGYNLAAADISLIQTLEISNIEYNDPDVSMPPPGLAQRLDIVKLLGIPILQCSITSDSPPALIPTHSDGTEREHIATVR